MSSRGRETFNGAKISRILGVNDKRKHNITATEPSTKIIKR